MMMNWKVMRLQRKRKLVVIEEKKQKEKFTKISEEFWIAKKLEDFRFLFENNKFPDTDSDATDVKVAEENTEDAAAVVDVEGKEVDVRAELDGGSKSNEIIWMICL